MKKKDVIEVIFILAIIAAFMFFFAFMCYKISQDNPKEDPNRDTIHEVYDDFETILE